MLKNKDFPCFQTRRCSIIMLINVKMPKVEHDESFITLGPGSTKLYNRLILIYPQGYLSLFWSANMAKYKCLLNRKYVMSMIMENIVHPD